MIFLCKKLLKILNKRKSSLIFNRCNYSDLQNEVRVRFAPSPTGFLHLGGLRTALFNYLFAKSNNGKFILRIEDTDQKRLVDGAMEQLFKDLEWAGLIPDEGPKYGGDYGPYIQSQRNDLYHKEVQKLMENGTAYHCFCSERRLELLQREAIRTQQVPKYDNRCRHLTPIQVAEKLAKGDKHCIRFKLESKGDSFNDLVYGNIVYYIAQNEGDPVIIKSDGFPTYHFANVIDDHHMRITHVLRGVEWQISTPKHILLCEAFGWQTPQYGHLPLVMNSDGSKLSKRQGDIKIDFYRDKGILPQALLNFITQSGGGFEREQGAMVNEQLPDLIQKFNVDRINAHSSRLNPVLLTECNRNEILHHIEDPVKCAAIIETLRNLVTKKYSRDNHNLDLEEQHLNNVLRWSTSRITSINELVEDKFAFLWILPKVTNSSDLNEDLLQSLVAILSDQSFTKTNLQAILKEFSTKNNLAFNHLMKSLRTILSGLKEGPGVTEMMEILGKENTLQRIIRTKRK